LAEGVDIRLNKEVTNIEYTPTGVRVTTKDGEVFSGDVGLVTVPLVRNFILICSFSVISFSFFWSYQLFDRRVF